MNSINRIGQIEISDRKKTKWAKDEAKWTHTRRTLLILNDWRYQTPFSSLTHNAQLRAVCDLHVGGRGGGERPILKKKPPLRSTKYSQPGLSILYYIAHESPRFPKYEVFVPTYSAQVHTVCDIRIPVYWEKKNPPNGTDSPGLPRCAPYCKINWWSFWRRDLPALSYSTFTGVLTLHSWRVWQSPPLYGSAWKVSGAGLAASPETPRWVYCS